MILVVGATGQLGSAVVRLLRSQDRPVRVFVRTEDAARRFEALGCESYVGDITHPGQAKSPFPRVETVVATASATTPVRPSDSTKSVDDAGYRNLISACLENSAVRQFVYVSVLTERDVTVPSFRVKKRIEEALIQSGLGYTIFRFPAFMDTSFPMMGSAFSARGLENATVSRDFPFMRRHLEKIQDSVEKQGLIHLTGDGSRRHAYICVDDAAWLIAASSGREDMIGRVIEITGPQCVSGEELAQIHERLLGRMLKRRYTPALALKLLSVALKPFKPAAANIMAITHFAATTDTPVTGLDLADELGMRLHSPEEFLRARLESGSGPAQVASTLHS